ncbi:hypothetical protein JMN32_18115 [Fulvivirga sp. 29W222]|uniref:Uncharacterized protein n=1 Tax=Fulvivirga marina TaxID=2494733 RepID=A0A937KFG4_9BACT|nr:hypothetical protein [Fulvivirga marina]MBL6448235.1 hypothetical protein [Fulvivirga marina]
MILFLIIGCGGRTNETESKTSAENEEIKEDIVDNLRFGGCGKFRNEEGDEAYMSVTHTEGEKQLKGICFGQNMNEPIWTGEFAGEVMSSDDYLFEIEVAYQINGNTVKVKEKWKIVDNMTFELVEGDPNRPKLPTEYVLINCINDFPEQQMFIEHNKMDYSHIKAEEKYYKAIDVNGSVIVKLKYYEGKAEVTGDVLGKVGEGEIWTGLITGNCINGKKIVCV